MYSFAIIGIFVYIGMLSHAYICKGDIECLSDIAYDKHRWEFPVLMSVMSFCLFLSAISVTQLSYQCLCFLAMVGSVGVGLTPYKDDGNNVIHKVCVLLSMISVIALWALRGMWWMPFVLMLAGLRKKWLLGIEMSMIASMFVYCLM